MTPRRRPHPVEAVIFDFDGTIIDTETPVFESWQQTYVAWDVLPLSPTEWKANIGHTSQPFHPLDELQRRVEASGRRFVHEEAVEYRLERRDAMLDRLEPRPGVIEWLESATSRGLGLAIASSSPSRWVEAQLTRIGLRDRFAVVSCAGGGVPSKPDPAVYTNACYDLGVSPAAGVAIEDSPVGAHAAAAAGLWGIAVPGPMTSGLPFAAADRQVGSLADLPAETWLSGA